MRIGITVLAYNQPIGLIRMAASAVAQTEHEVEFHLFRHGKSSDVKRACEEVASNNRCIYADFDGNRGVAKSWNDGLLSMLATQCDVMMLVNDDICFSDGDIDNIVYTAAKHPEAYAVFCGGVRDGTRDVIKNHGMACFLMNPIAVEVIGFFDEWYTPAYNEDLDYGYRARLAGLGSVIAKHTHVQHIGSAALKASPQLARQNHITHRLNDEYWERKWGIAKREYERKPAIVNVHPFNDVNCHPYYISPQERHSPYGKHGRTDVDVVKI